jgi:hypothetical protein
MVIDGMGKADIKAVSGGTLVAKASNGKISVTE